MTSTPNTIPEYPTEWHPIDIIKRVDCRQLSEDTFQLRNPTHTITVNKEGFNYYRDGSDIGFAAWEQWCYDNSVTARPRDDLDDKP